MPKFSQTSLARLQTCDKRLQELAHQVIKVIDFTVIEGHRNEKDQNAAYARGATKLKWPHGKHNAFPSKAIDVAPVYYDGVMRIDWDDLIAFGRLAGAFQMAAAMKGYKLRFGLDWDGDFRSVNRDPSEGFLDAPHIELVDE